MPCLEIGPTSSKKKYFLVHHDNGLGWHFLDWSIKYLSGRHKDFVFDNEKYSNLASDPLAKTQAHNHKINLVYSKEQLTYYNSLIETLNPDCAPPVLQNGITRYTVDTKNKNKKNLKGLSSDDLNELSVQTINAIVELTNLAVELGFVVISIHWSDSHRLIPAYQTRQGYDFNSGEPLESNIDVHNLWLETFFNTSRERFDDTVWDHRERLALCMRPFEPSLVEKQIQSINGVTSISTMEYWIHGDKLFSNTDLCCQAHWNLIYNNWQQLHDTRLSEDYDLILNSIVNNQSLDLSQYNLNLNKEALILHGLIYYYNLNLKSWKLEKFPSNTKDLNLLLEKNFHPLDLTYYKNF